MSMCVHSMAHVLASGACPECAHVLKEVAAHSDARMRKHTKAHKPIARKHKASWGSLSTQDIQEEGQQGSALGGGALSCCCVAWRPKWRQVHAPWWWQAWRPSTSEWRPLSGADRRGCRSTEITPWKSQQAASYGPRNPWWWLSWPPPGSATGTPHNSGCCLPACPCPTRSSGTQTLGPPWGACSRCTCNAHASSGNNDTGTRQERRHACMCPVRNCSAAAVSNSCQKQQWC